jgi:hypothetical protein
MKMKKLTILSLLLVTSSALLAQTKMDIYTNSNIVWAGIVDIDIVINADTSTDWKYYEISGLGKYLKQYSKDLKPNEKALNQIIIDNANEISFYQYDSLKDKVNYPMAELYEPGYEPQSNGDKNGRLPASEFDVFRLRCFIYYDKTTLNFKIKPLAVAILNSEDDTGNALDYHELGWLPVAKWVSEMSLRDESLTFSKRFYRDITFEEVNVFKREWNIEQVMQQLMDEVRQQSETIQLFTSDVFEPRKKLLSDEVKLLGTDEIYAMKFDSFDEEQQFVPWSPAVFKGVRLTLNWSWDDIQKSLFVKESAFGPLYEVVEADDEVLHYQYLFVKPIR